MHIATTNNVEMTLITSSSLIASVGIDTTFENTIRSILFKGSCTHMIIKLFCPKYAKYCPPELKTYRFPKKGQSRRDFLISP